MPTLNDEEAQAATLQMLTRASRPLLVGEVALELKGWSLMATEGLFLRMALAGLIRPITKAEKKRFDMRNGWWLV